MAAAQPAARDSMRENRTAAAVERVPGATRIMGVDPGLTRCGFSMLDMTADRKAHFVNVGVAGTIPAESLDQRILWISTPPPTGSTPTSRMPWRLSVSSLRSR